MAPLHETVLADVARWLNNGQRAWLCTILETWGSSPRPAGSWLALNEQGDWSGSVSGGCLEEDLIRRCTQTRPTQPHIMEYGVTDGDRQTFQLPCGGTINLLIEPLTPETDLAHIQDLQQALAGREAIVRQIQLESGEASLAPATGQERDAVTKGDGQVCHRLSPVCQVLLVGAGEVARHVADFAMAADFQVCLCEPRTTFARGWRADSAPLIQMLPDDLVMSDYSGPFSAVLALAHDPRVDDMALLAALKGDGFYIGAMGSVATSRARRQRLASLGLSDEELARLKAPIGVDIPSKTPAEIAISVVADLIRARHDLLVIGTPL